MSYYSGDPEPTVPFDPRQVPPALDRYPRQYVDPTRQNPTSYPPFEAYDNPPQPSYPIPHAGIYGQLEPAGPYQSAAYYGYPADPRRLAYSEALYAAQKSRVAAGLLGIFLGSLGIHNFYLGRTGIGLLQLLLTVLTLGILSPAVALWSLIESILILTRSPSFITDAKGVPLRD